MTFDSHDLISNYSHSSLAEISVLESYMHTSGAMIEKVKVPDESQTSDTFISTRMLLNKWDDELLQTDNPLPPYINKGDSIIESRNPVSERFYKDKSIQEWALLMPSARALFYLTHLNTQILPSGQPISEIMTRFMREMDDGIGIRTRKRIALKVVNDTIKQANESIQCLSLACGAADLMLEVLAASEKEILLTLVDIDDDALSMARSIATANGLKEGSNYNIEKINLLHAMVRSDKFVYQLGEKSQDVVDAIGINEYFSLSIATRFLVNAYRCVKPGGLLITANMLSDRSQMQINKLAIGWPKLYPRSVDDIVIMLQNAGLPIEHTKIIIPEDGIYAMIEIRRPN